MTIDRSTLHRAIAALLLFAVVLALYLPVRGFQFINFDDNVYLTANAVVRDGLSWNGLRWAFDPGNGGDWHPLAWLSHMLDVTLFGLVPGKHHLVNAGLHAANTAMFYVLLVSLGWRDRAAGAAALVFGVHPLRMESVAWVSERKDVLSAFLGLVAVQAYVLRARGGGRWYAVAAFVAYALSLLSKPTLVTLPFLLLLLDRGCLKRGCGWARLFAEKVPWLMLAALTAAAAVIAQHTNGGYKALDSVTAADRLNIVFPAYLAYLGKLLWPSNLSIFYPLQPYPAGVAAGALCGLAAITALLVAARRSAPVLLSAWIWFLISLLPMIGLVSVGGQAFADRWTYVPHMGLIAGIAHWTFERARPAGVAISGWAACALLLTLLTVNWLPAWHDSKTIFTRALESSPDNFMAHTNLGVALFDEGNLTGAAPHYEEAVRLNPRYPEALNNLGTLLATQGRVAEGKQYFERALAVRPNFAVARQNLEQAGRDLGR